MPVFTTDVGSEENFLILEHEDLDSALYGQLCDNLWVIPENLLAQYVRGESYSLFHSLLPVIRDFQLHYHLYGEPIGPACICVHPFNILLKGLLCNGDEMIQETLTMFKPCEILSTFDRKTEEVFEFNGETFLVYNVSSHCS